MNIKLKVIGLVLIAIGVGLIGFLPQDKPKDIVEQPDQDEQVMRPTETIEIGKNVTDDGNGYVIKKFIHGDTEIIYQVGVENGVEETPMPSVREAMRNAYSEYEKQMIDENTHAQIFNRYGDYKEVFLNNQMYHSLTNHSKLKQDFIDINFSCDNYHDLAYQFTGEVLSGHGYYGTAENYVYTRAINECIDPKHQEEIEKVYADLEEVNKSNDIGEN